MDQSIKDWIELVVRVLAGVGALGFSIAAFSYRNHIKIKQAEWLKSLFEKFFETGTYKEVRGWLDYDKLEEKLGAADEKERMLNEEKFTDFLNFFEFIGVLYVRKQLTFEQVHDVFDYYLEKIRSEPICQKWIDKYGFEKLAILLKKFK